MFCFVFFGRESRAERRNEGKTHERKRKTRKRCPPPPPKKKEEKNPQNLISPHPIGKTLCGVCTTMYLLLGSTYGISGTAALRLK